MEYHTIYKGPEGETTKWDDIQRKLGNLPAKEPVWKPDAYAPEDEGAATRRDAAFLDGADEAALEAAAEDFGDDRFLEEYRRRRLEELRRGPPRPRFGSVEELRRSEFVAQVTNAGEGVWVVCHLYKDSAPGCAILGQCLGELAERYPDTKFRRIVSTDCIPGYPDENLPTVLLYRDTKCVETLVGLARFGGQAASPDAVALALNAYGSVCGDAGDWQAHVRGMVSRALDAQEAAAGRPPGGGGAGGDAEDESSDLD